MPQGSATRCSCPRWPAIRVPREADHRLARIVGRSLKIQQLVHAPSVLCRELGGTPHQLASIASFQGSVARDHVGALRSAICTQRSAESCKGRFADCHRRQRL
jgi:hypothetical protein